MDVSRPEHPLISQAIPGSGSPWPPISERSTLLPGLGDEQYKLWFAAAGRQPRLLRDGSYFQATRWSADGKWLFLEGTDEFSIYDVEHDELVRYAGSRARAAAWHPSEPRFAYFDPDPEPAYETGLLVIVDARRRQRLPWMQSAAGMAWSPDGRRLAVAAKDRNGSLPCPEQLLILDARGTSLPATLVTCGHLEDFRWSGDGSWLAYRQVSPPRVGVFHLESGAHHALLDTSEGRLRLSWALEANHLVSGDDDGAHVALLDTPASPAGITLREARRLRWSPDGRYLVLEQASSLVLVDVREPAVSYRIGLESCADPRCCLARFSPSGEWLAYGVRTRGNFDLMVRRVGSPPSAPRRVTTWSELELSAIFQVMLPDDPARPTKPDDRGPQPNAFWAPMGASLVFARKLGQYKVQLEMASLRDDWQTRVLATHAGGTLFAPAWRPKPEGDLDIEDPAFVYEPPRSLEPARGESPR